MEIRETAHEGIQQMMQPPNNGGFQFACHPGVPCFTECCRDLSLLLTPYDSVRLKGRLGLSSSEFIDRYADCRFDESRHLPMLYLQMAENEHKTCPFVSEKGCLLYEDRPSACQIYPIARASRIQRLHGTLLEDYFVLHEEHCRGFEEEQFREVKEWLQDQGLKDYCRSNELWMEIVTHPRLRNVPLSDKQQQIIYFASYNSDKFREMVLNSRFLSLFNIFPEESEEIKQNETALLKLAFNWMKLTLLGEPALGSQ
ncbi:MAG: YkgJ family cysteine cluster protein [Syntrophobacteraceae bacterium]